MDAPLDEEYFVWLYQQVASVKLKNPQRTYWSLLRQLYTKEFIWLIPNDDNRVEDGRDLRMEFVEQTHIPVPRGSWMGLGCSILEMLVGLSRRLAFESEGEASDWFWTMLENVDLRRFSDASIKSNDHTDEIDDVLERVIWRQYEKDGRGGFFPLEHAVKDQREVELWYQLSAYLNEREEG